MRTCNFLLFGHFSNGTLCNTKKVLFLEVFLIAISNHSRENALEDIIVFWKSAVFLHPSLSSASKNMEAMVCWTFQALFHLLGDMRSSTGNHHNGFYLRIRSVWNRACRENCRRVALHCDIEACERLRAGKSVVGTEICKLFLLFTL